jgi:hypothetical protein
VRLKVVEGLIVEVEVVVVMVEARAASSTGIEWLL